MLFVWALQRGALWTSTTSGIKKGECLRYTYVYQVKSRVLNLPILIYVPVEAEVHKIPHFKAQSNAKYDLERWHFCVIQNLFEDKSFNLQNVLCKRNCFFFSDSSKFMVTKSKDAHAQKSAYYKNRHAFTRLTVTTVTGEIVYFGKAATAVSPASG